MRKVIKMITVLFVGINGFCIPSIFKTNKMLASNPIMQVRESYSNTETNNWINPNKSSKTGIFNPYHPDNKKDNINTPIIIQGGSLRTWSYKSPYVEQVQVILTTEGRPLDSDIELWHGPDNVPCKMRIYVENGQLRPFSAVIETPRGPNTIAIRNIGQVEFPIIANVIANDVDTPSSDCMTTSNTIQGGALRTYPFSPVVNSVQVMLKTDGRPLNARIELLQGPNNNKHVVELYTEDGLDRPFFCILETPGSGNVIRVVNTAPIEFPMTASVVPNSISEDLSSDPTIGGDVFMGGDIGW